MIWQLLSEWRIIICGCIGCFALIPSQDPSLPFSFKATDDICGYFINMFHLILQHIFTESSRNSLAMIRWLLFYKVLFVFKQNIYFVLVCVLKYQCTVISSGLYKLNNNGIPGHLICESVSCSVVSNYLQPLGQNTRRRQWHPTPVLLAGKSHGRRSLVGCSPWGRQSQTRLSDFTFTFHFHALEKEMATHSSVLVWRIPGTGEPGGLPSIGSHRVGHD